MRLPEFDLERIQSLYENTVEFNLTESGFHPYTLEELLSPDELSRVQQTVLSYGQTNGSPGLRRAIAALYLGQDADNVLATNGSSEANYVACRTLLEPGDEVVVMLPNYMQIWGIARGMGIEPTPFRLREEDGWSPDLDELAAVVSGATKVIAVCNPNNPTGYTLSEAEMSSIVTIADRAGAWIYADEVYRGAELDGVERPSFIGMYDRVMVAGGLSKAYALPGLRLGWLVGPTDVIDDAWSYHDYTSITAGILSHVVGEMVLSPDVRPSILERNRELLRGNLALVREWARQFGGNLSMVPPRAGGMTFFRYGFDINSTELSDWLRIEKGVFVLAGDVFGMDGFLRIGSGAEPAFLQAALERLGAALTERFGQT